MGLERELDESRAKLRELDAAVARRVGKQARRRHPGNRVRLQDHRLALGRDDEVAARATRAAEHLVGGLRERLRTRVDRGRDAGGNHVVKLGGLVLDARVVEVGPRHDLHDGQRVGLLIADNGHRYLGALDAFLDKHALAARACQLDRPFELRGLGYSRDAIGAAVAGGLDKERQPELAHDDVDLFRREQRPGRDVAAAGATDAGVRVEDLRHLLLGGNRRGENAGERIGDAKHLEQPLNAAVLPVPAVERRERDVIAAAPNPIHEVAARDVEQVHAREPRLGKRLGACLARDEAHLGLIRPAPAQNGDLEALEFFCVHRAP